VLAVGMLAAGCLSPGRVDPTILNRYQKVLTERGPRQRGREELDQLRPAPSTTVPKLKVLKDKQTGQARIELSLDETIRRTLANNTDIQVVSFDSAISREDMIKAAAEFDYVVFGEYTYQREDDRTNTLGVAGQARTQEFQAGVKQKTITGADWSLRWSMNRTWDNSTFSVLRTRYEPKLIFEITQPLLRDAWPGFNLAGLKLARLNHKISIFAFRAKVEEIITKVISTYWSLVRARRELEIQQSLLDMTEETLARVKARGGLDATAVHIKQIEAAVESRRAALIRARKTALDVQELLARLLADAQINVLSAYEIVPTTSPITELVQMDITDQLLTALRHNPLLEQARLAIAMADIDVYVAANQTLPRLDLKASAGLQGLGPTRREARNELFTGNYASYALTLSGEYPLGNRERLAQLHRNRFERLKAIAVMQNIADQMAAQIKDRIREIGTSYQEIQAQGSAVNAARIQLQALEDTERIRGQLTPEFLQVKLQAQEAVATAERSELKAITDYNSAMVDLARTTGTVLELHRVRIALPVAAGEADWPVGPPGSSPVEGSPVMQP